MVKNLCANMPPCFRRPAWSQINLANSYVLVVPCALNFLDPYIGSK